MRVRKLQEEKDQMVSTIIIGGCSLHINEQNQLFDINNFQKESCIFSLQQQYTNKYDQHIVIHLKTELKERLKFNSTLSIQLMQMNLSYTYLQIAMRIIMTPQFQLIWCKSGINKNYCDQIGEIKTDEMDSKSLSDEATIEFNDDFEQALEKSYVNEDDTEVQFEESQIEGLNQSEIQIKVQRKQSIFSVSVFKELINDEDDKQGLEELDDGQLIFKVKSQKVRIRLSRNNIIDKWSVDNLKNKLL
ncbi:unnamed protein product [Paramecium sonneborni]|uniref:Uncharacterized protein n=1 Tax=Paramecium sonneborni TaxID=65129 RepID=A0A8S1RTE2_9CILI|nr:unnamed protein product [Paramecium sonneborni]